MFGIGDILAMGSDPLWCRRVFGFVGIFSYLWLGGCIPPEMGGASSAAAPLTGEASPMAVQSAEKSAAVPPGGVAPSPCIKLPADATFPQYLPSQSAFVVSMNKTCMTADNSPGVEPDSSFLAMGFPCSAGGGKVDITGKHYGNPQMISLLLTNSCPMKPVDQQAFLASVRERYGLNDKGSMLALYPFEVHYWELIEFNDADLGEIVELRSTAALKKGWKRLTDGGALHLRMYGYENGWIDKHHLYAVEAEVKLVARKRFGIQILSAQSMDEQQALEVKKRCEAIRIGQNCDRVFVAFPSD